MLEKIIIATLNQHKLKEINKSFNWYSSNSGLNKKINIIGLNQLDHIDIKETGKTFFENAQIKAKTVFNKYGCSALGDDSGLVIPVLNGDPGIKSARYAGDQASDRENNQKLIKKLKTKGCFDNYGEPIKAYFITVLVLWQKINMSFREIVGKGVCHGTIIAEPRGNNGFGYDPIFLPEEKNKELLTFAEMSLELKNSYSHRQKALLNLLKKHK